MLELSELGQIRFANLYDEIIMLKIDIKKLQEKRKCGRRKKTFQKVSRNAFFEKLQKKGTKHCHDPSQTKLKDRVKKYLDDAIK